jgi:hypothetical protein
VLRAAREPRATALGNERAASPSSSAIPSTFRRSDKAPRSYISSACTTPAAFAVPCWSR